MNNLSKETKVVLGVLIGLPLLACSVSFVIMIIAATIQAISTPL